MMPLLASMETLSSMLIPLLPGFELLMVVHWRIEQFFTLFQNSVGLNARLVLGGCIWI